jgi:hypothetical protein
MNFITKWIVKGKISKFLRAEKFTGYRTEICMAIFLAAWGAKKLALSQGFGPEVLSVLTELQEMVLGLGGLALAAKVKRSGPEGNRHIETMK